MSYVPNYEHDIFISYARVDNDPLPGAELDKVTGRKRGWVSTLILDGLKKELAKQLGRADSYSLWMDDAGLPGNESVTPFIDKQVKNSATVVFIVSPGYLASPWCRLEFNTFLEQVNTESGRLFMVETQRLDQDEKLPEFEKLRGYQFWRPDQDTGIARTMGIPKPNPDLEPEYYTRLADLAFELAGKLKQLRKEELAKAEVTDEKKLSRTKTLKKSRLESDKASLLKKITSLEKDYETKTQSLQLNLPEANRQAINEQLEQIEAKMEELEAAVEKTNCDLEKLQG